MSRKRTWKAAACAAVSALALTACGSSHSSSSTASARSSGSSASRAPTGAPIVVGSICSCSGVFAATQGGGDQVATAWADSVNAAGGINGHPVRMFTEDDGGNPTTALLDVKQLVENDKVVAIVGDDSTTSASWAPYVSAKGIPVVGGLSLSAPATTDPDWFPNGGGLPDVYADIVQQLQAAGKKKVGFMYCAEAPACKEAVGILAAFAAPVGIQVESIAVSASAPSYAAPCLKFKDDNVDALIPGLDAVTASRVVAACIQQGFNPKLFVGTASYTPVWLKDPNFNGAVMVSSNANLQDNSIPGVQQYQTAVKKYAPSLDVGSAGYNQFTVWVGGMLFEAAAKAADIGPSSTSADVKNGLYALKGETLGGTAPALTYEAGKPTSIPCLFSITISGGTLKSDNNGQPTCLPSQAAAIAKKMT